ncbi:MAG: hypothetical protein ACRDMX_18170 [Solirubrobacteraceae bacterium]
MKRWLSPWLLPLVMLGSVLLITLPVAGVIWIVLSVVVVRLINGRLQGPASLDERFMRTIEDVARDVAEALELNYFKKPS